MGDRSTKQRRRTVKQRSPYAKDLEGRKYRQQVIQRKRAEDIDNWIEDALEEYYNERQTLDQRSSEENEAKVRRTTEGADDHGRTDASVLQAKEKKRECQRS